MASASALKRLEHMVGLTSMMPGTRDKGVGQTRAGPLPKSGTMGVLTEIRVGGVEGGKNRIADGDTVAGIEDVGEAVLGSEGVEEFDNHRRIADGDTG